MDRFLPVISFFVLAVATSHAALPAQVYWNRVLPQTPMPSAITDLLFPDGYTDEKVGTAVNVGKGGVNVNTGKGKPGGTSVGVGHGGVNVNTGKGKPGGTSVGVGHGGVNVNTGKGKPGGTSVGVGHGGVHVNTGKGKPGGAHVNVGHGSSPFVYNYAATETQIHDNRNTAIFFLEKDMQPGTKMTLHFVKTTSGAALLPRQISNSIPFSSSKLPEIFNHFSIQPNSVEAESMEQTLKECEEPGMVGENKYCATSLESMVEFSMSNLGTRKVQAISTTVPKEETPKQQYTMTSSAVQKTAGSKFVVCHAKNYAYAVFYCHSTQSTKAYKVQMVGKDGSAVDAVAVCHTDTSRWNPKHLAFRLLNVKPGSVPVCHFLPQDHLVWSTKN